ncbi:E3 ubiquitin-protein ligase TRIM33-like [Mya arenaria]|uniref:E3 ubiquitin-protein ligase TRIM33-like n=1 Tax=Mya arenaria TaxID=6604 RepID=UPI0022E8BC35|nr:E3 ubiquitin-protein ligase TRIM33-like [Mya arenaria]
MAYNLESSFQQASDLIHDFTCSPCKDDGLNNEAHFFCDECKKYYCNNCVQLHNKLFRTHSVLGRQDVSKWVGYAGLSPIEKCDKHGDKKLELLCEDHDELCCPICVSLTHRMCQSIKHIPDLSKGLKTQIDFKKLPADVDTITTRLQGITKKRTHNKQSLKDSGKKILAEIKSLRKKVIEKFDDIEKKTKDILENQLHEADDFLQDDIDKCTKLTDKLKTYLNTIQSQQDDNISYIAYKKCKDKMSDAESLLQELSTKPDTSLTFQADPRFEQCLSGLNALGKIITFPSKDMLNKFDISHVFKIKARSQYIVKMPSDKKMCGINGICKLPGGEILITDYNNTNLKLLNSQYQVTATCDLPAKPNHLCHIAGYEAAVTLDDKSVHYITVAGSTLTVSRKMTFPHDCIGISHHNGNLYVGSWTAIYQYTMSGQLVKKIYEDNSASGTVNAFTVSRDGTKIYIPASSHNKLITIDTSGNILSTLLDPDINWPYSVCVSDRGHTFVCSNCSKTVTQVDKDGKHKLATVAIWKGGLRNPSSIWFDNPTSNLIVGGCQNELSVFALE